MLLFENNMMVHSQTIRGVRYITNSYYGGEQDIFQKMRELITTPLPLSEPAKVPKDSLVGSDMAIDGE